MLSRLENKRLIAPQLWVTRVGGDNHALESRANGYLQPSSLVRLQSISSVKKRRQFITSRWLIQQALSALYPEANTADIIEQKNAAPLIPMLSPDYYFSLSHSVDWIAFILSPDNVGVDIEKKRDRKNQAALAKTFMTDAEYQLYQTDEKLFYRIWCLKEAVFKALTREHQTAGSFFELDTAGIFAQQCQHVMELTVSDYQLTVYQPSAAIQQIDYFELSEPMLLGKTPAASWQERQTENFSRLNISSPALVNSR